MTLFISSLEFINVVKTVFYELLHLLLLLLLLILTVTLSANGLSTFPVKSKPIFSNGAKSLPKIPPDGPILHSWVFESFTSADELLLKALQIFESCVSVNNNLCEKLVSSLELPFKFNERFKVTSALFFISYFNLASYELDNLTFKVLYGVIFCIKEKVKLEYFYSSLLRIWNYFLSVSSEFCLLKSIAII